MASSRPCPEVGLDLIKFCEGFVDHVYICPAGHPTIGYGHVVQPGEQWSTITEPEAVALLRRDIVRYENGVLRLISVPLPDYCYAALVSFTYNLGEGALQASTLRRLTNQGRLEEAAVQFDRWVFAGAQKLPGLVKRRALSRALWEKGLYQP